MNESQIVQLKKHKELIDLNRKIISGIKSVARKNQKTYSNKLEAYGDFCLISGELEDEEDKIWYSKKLLDKCARGYLYKNTSENPLTVEEGYDSIEDSLIQHIKTEIKLLSVIYNFKDLKNEKMD